MAVFISLTPPPDIKAVLVNEDGTLVLSGSSDGSIRLWDLGQQRNVHTYDPHTDSVWALAADQAFSKVYSGGRDKRIFVTGAFLPLCAPPTGTERFAELSSGESNLLCEEVEPVVRLLLQGDDTLWSTSTSPAIHAWSLEAAQQRKKAKFACGCLFFSLSLSC